ETALRAGDERDLAAQVERMFGHRMLLCGYMSACRSPSIGSACPEMLLPAGEARKTIALAMSSALTNLRSDVLARPSARTTSVGTPRAAALFANTLSMR